MQCKLAPSFAYLRGVMARLPMQRASQMVICCSTAASESRLSRLIWQEVIFTA